MESEIKRTRRTLKDLEKTAMGRRTWKDLEKTAVDRRACKDYVVDLCLQGAKR
jgi:hypothetical protein